MRFSQRNRSKAPALALTSMLDVIFLLLCFFVTVSVFSQWESEISIKLPNAKTAESPERLPGEIIINLAKDGKISVNSVALTLEDLGARLAKVAKFYPGQPVIIRADKEVRYETLVKLIDTCRASDIWNFSLATEGEKGAE
jgi:biopolymer transport protein ExbD